ncbi:histamine N-methyltransferase-like [Saccoglossus kowalevskii]|uniref:Histamine N-methyltransferase-like n=1 Tax=Saccoglossus kowalevskii TaxID=10224 RepID=A0ABM0MUV2_SACKO|nr:PREDICTED: histamine N-methyltransferase-like [Saccoglossus kowalevskii]
MADTSRDLTKYPQKYHQAFKSMMDHGLKSREFRYKDDARKLIEQLQLSSSNKICILSIGAGSGDVDLHFINALVDKYTAIHYTVVEPATDQIDEFKSLIECHKDKWNGVKFDFRTQGINEYIEEGGTCDKYDVILACHSFYYFHDTEHGLRCLYDMIRPDGVLLIRLEAAGPLDEFKSLIESNQDGWSGVKFSFHVQEINEYFEGGVTSDKYDVIHACHS